MQRPARPRSALTLPPPPGLEMSEQLQFPVNIPLRVEAADALDARVASAHGVPYAAPPPAEAFARPSAPVPGGAVPPRTGLA